MILAVPPAAMYGLFGIGLVAATFPLWRQFVFGFTPTLEELLRLGCLQP
jgi:hypothetical protein